jgi:hypothetical protein
VRVRFLCVLSVCLIVCLCVYVCCLCCVFVVRGCCVVVVFECVFGCVHNRCVFLARIQCAAGVQVRMVTQSMRGHKEQHPHT